jgi:hypothetical protein
MSAMIRAKKKLLDEPEDATDLMIEEQDQATAAMDSNVPQATDALNPEKAAKAAKIRMMIRKMQMAV